jgi:hypothetical protein
VNGILTSQTLLPTVVEVDAVGLSLYVTLAALEGAVERSILPTSIVRPTTPSG